MAIVLLDSGILGLISNPFKYGESGACEEWLFGLLARSITVVSSQVCYYEVRRSLLLQARLSGKTKSLENLDDLRSIIEFVSVDLETWIIATQLWADARLRGLPMTDNRSLDADIIICAQYQILSQIYPGQNVVIATTNVKHLSQFATAGLWQNINF
jgi:predicted nucleic acid-binding protein